MTSPALSAALSAAAPVARTRTPPDLKWLLNERAALAGQLQRAQHREEQGQFERREILNQVRVLESKLTRYQAQSAAVQARLRALDVTISIAYTPISPDVAGVVNAWQGKYGPRGGLRRFLIQSLEQVTPRSLTTLELMSGVIQFFCIQIENPAERRSLRCTITKELRRLRDDAGVVESLHKIARVRTSGVWRWKASLSLADLAALSAQQEAYGEQDVDAAH